MAKRSKELGNPAMLALAQTAMERRVNKSSPPPGKGQAEQPNVARKVGNAVLAGGLVLLSGGALFLVGRSILRGAKFKSSVNKTDDPSTPEYFAHRLYQGMNPDTPFGWGTDKEVIRATIQAVPHRRFWESVKDAYRRLTRGGNLMDDLAGDLSRNEKQDLDMILAVLPTDAKEARNYDPNKVTPQRLQAWATRIKAASEHESSWMWPYGTDEEAMYAVLHELPTAMAACQLDRACRQMHGTGLFARLDDELDSVELRSAYQIIMSKPDAVGRSLIQVIASCTSTQP